LVNLQHIKSTVPVYTGC